MRVKANFTVLISYTGAWGYSNSVPLEPGAYWKYHKRTTFAFLHIHSTEQVFIRFSGKNSRTIDLPTSALFPVWVVGQSSDTEEDQGLAVWSGQWRGNREPLRPTAKRDSRKELC